MLTAQGRAVPATEIVWMRVREVAVHAVDLGVGIGFGDLPAALCEALIGDVAARRSAQGDGPALQLESSEGGSWRVDGVGAATAEGAAAWLSSPPGSRAAARARWWPRAGALPELAPPAVRSGGNDLPAAYRFG